MHGDDFAFDGDDASGTHVDFDDDLAAFEFLHSPGTSREFPWKLFIFIWLFCGFLFIGSLTLPSAKGDDAFMVGLVGFGIDGLVLLYFAAKSVLKGIVWILKRALGMAWWVLLQLLLLPFRVLAALFSFIFYR